MKEWTYKNNLECDFSYYYEHEGETQRYDNDTGSVLFCTEIGEAFQRKGSDNESINQIYKNLTQLAGEYAGDRGADFFASWVNIHRPGDAAPPHTHEHADFTTIYYIEVPENSGDLYIQGTTDEIEQFSPKAYDFVAIPAEYVHATGLNRASVNRVSLITDWFYGDTTKEKKISESATLLVSKAMSDLLSADKSDD